MELQILSEKDFDAVYALLKQSFPPDEYRDSEKQKALFQNKLYTAYGLLEGNQLQALLALWNFGHVIYIEHFAVTEASRNCGLGSRILETMKTMADCPLCLEVELPDNDMARRRIAFYERNGFTYNDYPYIQPAYSPEKATVPLRFMTTGGGISAARFAEIKACIYREVYNVTE